jgi:hypothetical protein
VTDLSLFLNARKVLKDAVEVNAMHAPRVVALLVTASATHVPLVAVLHALLPQPQGVVATQVVVLLALLPQAATQEVVVAVVMLAALLPRPAALHVENATAAMLLVKESIHRFINTILSRFLKVLVLPKIGRS